MKCKKFFTLLALLLALALAAPGWADSVKVGSKTELLEAIKKPSTIEFTADIEIDECLSIGNTVNIKGNGHTLRLKQKEDTTVENTRVIMISADGVTIDGLTITGGRDGGIWIAASQITVKVTNCTFINNTAYGGGGMSVHSKATAMIINCTFTGNTATSEGNPASAWGGGLEVAGKATVINCTFVNNEATYGRDIFVASGATVNAVNTIFWNDEPGAICNMEYNEGVSQSKGTLNLYNCAYGANAIGGVIDETDYINSPGTVKLTPGDVPVYENGCVTNLNWTGRTAAEADGADGVKHTVFTLTAADKDLINAGLAAADMPTTITLDEAAKAALATDQPGYKRDSKPDIGAVEYYYVAATGVTLDRTTASIDVGGTVKLTATVLPDSATDKTVTWSTSNEAVVSVDQTGVVTALKAGGPVTITVTATNGTANDATDDKSATCQVTVDKGTPTVTKTPTATSITYGQKLSESALSDGAASVGGTFAWQSPDIKPAAGTQTFTAIFTPQDGKNYNVTSTDVSVEVSKGTPTITANPTASAITEGQTLSDSTLNGGTASVAGTFKWKDKTIEPAVSDSNKTEYTVVFTPTETANYNSVTVQVTLTVNPKPSDDDKSGGDSTDKATEEQKAEEVKQEAEKAVESIQDSALADTTAGNALTETLTNGTTEQKEAATKVLNDLTASYSDEELKALDLNKDDIDSAIANKQEQAESKAYEDDKKEVKNPTVPAATDLLEGSDLGNALKEQNVELTVSPKIVEPEPVSETSKDQIAGTLGVEIQTDVTIEPASRDLKGQTEAVEKVFNEVSADLAGATNSTGGKGVVIAAVFPKIKAGATSGFYPLKMNLRHLTPGRKPKFWPSVEFFLAAAEGASGKISVAGVELADAEGDCYFLDAKGNKVNEVKGDASNMTVVPYLTAGKEYSDAFITVDATEKDQPGLEVLKETGSGGNGDPDAPDSPTSNKGSGGCDALSGGLLALVALGLVARRKK